MAVQVKLSNNKSYVMLPGFIVVALASLFLLLSACGVFPVRMTIEPIALVLFSLLLASSAYFIFLAVQKLNSKQIGLIVNDEGFACNATALGSALGFIRWEDVKSLDTIDGLGNSYLAVKVHNPDSYLIKVKSSFLRNQTRKRIYKSNKHQGVLLTISANGLCDFSFSELEKLLNDKLNNFRKEL